jgi:thioredoxin 1
MSRKTLITSVIRKGMSAAAVAVALLSMMAVAQAQQQFHPRTIYGDPAQAHAEIREALAKAAREHKRVILDFGGNWCGDCQVLDIYFHQEPNASLLRDHYVLVDVNIGRYDQNTDIAEKYAVPLKRGVPALAVLSSHGELLYSQKSGEFENMRNMDSASVTDFLTRWKSAR